MPSPFEILAQGDQNTARLFAGINAGIEATAKRQEDSLNKVATLAVAKEEIIQNRQKLTIAEQKFKINTFLDVARLNLSAAQSAAALEMQARQLMAYDSKAKTDLLKDRTALTIKSAMVSSVLNKDLSIIERANKSLLEEYNNINSPVGDFTPIRESVDRVNNFWKASSALFPTQGLEPSVFGGNEPHDSGVNNFGQKTGPGGLEGIAINDELLDQAGIPRAQRANAKVRITTSDGREAVVGIADKGPRNPNRADMTQGVIEQLGGRVILNEQGQPVGVDGIGPVNIELLSSDGNPFAANKTDLAKQFPPSLPTEAQTREFIDNPAALGAAVLSSPNNYDHIKDLKQANEFETMVKVLFADEPNLGNVMIADMKRTAPAYKEQQISVLRRVAAITDVNISPSDSDVIGGFQAMHSSLGGDVSSFDSLAAKVHNRNMLQVNLDKNFDKLSSIRNSMLSPAVLDTLPPQGVKEDENNPSLFKQFQDQVNYLNDESSLARFQIKELNRQINEQAELAPLPVKPVPLPPKDTVETATGRFLGSNPEVDAVTSGLSEQRRKLSESSSFEEVFERFNTKDIPSPKVSIDSAISEITSVSPSDLNMVNLRSEDSLSRLRKELNGKSIKPSSVSSIVIDNLIPKLRDDADARIVRDAIEQSEDNELALLKFNEIKNNSTDDALKIMGKILISKGLVNRKDKSIVYDVSSSLVGAAASINEIETAKKYMSILSNKSDEEKIDIIPMLKVAQILSAFKG